MILILLLSRVFLFFGVARGDGFRRWIDGACWDFAVPDGPRLWISPLMDRCMPRRPLVRGWDWQLGGVVAGAHQGRGGPQMERWDVMRGPRWTRMVRGPRWAQMIGSRWTKVMFLETWKNGPQMRSENSVVVSASVSPPAPFRHCRFFLVAPSC